MNGKHEKIHLLIISEKGRVKSRKVPFRLVKYLFFLLIFLLILTSFFTYLYWRQFNVLRLSGNNASVLLKRIARLETQIEDQTLELSRLKGVVKRLKSENEDLKRHFVRKKVLPPAAKVAPTPGPGTAVSPPPAPDKNMLAFNRFVSQMDRLKPVSNVTFHIRDPKIIVSSGESLVTFKLYKESLKKVYGRYILVGIYRPKDAQKAGLAASYPARSMANFRLRPRYGYPFKINRGFLPVTVRLTHPKGVKRFTEFHVLLYNPGKKLIFHVKFKAP